MGCAAGERLKPSGVLRLHIAEAKLMRESGSETWTPNGGPCDFGCHKFDPLAGSWFALQDEGRVRRRWSEGNTLGPRIGFQPFRLKMHSETCAITVRMAGYLLNGHFRHACE